MDKGIDTTIRKFVFSVAGTTLGFVTAYLFGSYAKNLQTPDSDIDIAIVIEDLKDSEKFDLQVRLMMLASQFDTRIEPHPLSKSDLNSGNPFAYEIMRTGIEIKTVETHSGR